MADLIGDDPVPPIGPSDPVGCTHPNDCDWHYEPADWDVGIPDGWVCYYCGKSDSDRPPPSD